MKLPFKNSLLITLLISLIGCSESSETNKAPTINDILKKQALDQLNSKSYGPGALCDKIINPTLDNVVYGTATSGYGKTRFPAITANYKGTCIKTYTGDQEPISQFHVVLAFDELGDKLRCVKVASKKVVSEVASGCSFKQNSPPST